MNVLYTGVTKAVDWVRASYMAHYLTTRGFSPAVIFLSKPCRSLFRVKLRSIYFEKTTFVFESIARFSTFVIERQDWHKEPVNFNFGMLVLAFQLTLAAVEICILYNFQQTLVKHLKFEEIKATREMAFLFWTQKQRAAVLFYSTRWRYLRGRSLV